LQLDRDGRVCFFLLLLLILFLGYCTIFFVLLLLHFDRCAVVFSCVYRENAVEILQRYRRDRRKLLDFMLAGSLIKKVIMPPGAVTLDDVDLDQVSVDYVINCAKKGTTSFFLLLFS